MTYYYRGYVITVESHRLNRIARIYLDGVLVAWKTTLAEAQQWVDQSLAESARAHNLRN
jgi:hypothetical protein